ncbi:MAG: hypothetical protein KGI60_03645 [Patescibacteria group bacterium]|nr:hypothetical protein [Patescibacteria group bacterium]
MNRFFHNAAAAKSIIVFILIGMVLAPISATLRPAVAEAGLPVTVDLNTDPGTIAFYLHQSGQANLQSLEQSVTAGNSIKSWSQTILEYAKATALAVLKNAILNRLTDAVIAWINNGGKGAIIPNWNAFIANAENDAAGAFVQQIGAGFLCSPFNLQVQLALAPVHGPFTQETCTLNQIIGNINNFMADFQNGSWLAYQEVWYPRNNFYGSVIMGLDAQTQAEFAAKEAATNEAVAGKGFLSFKKCSLVQDPNGTLDSSGNAVGPAGNAVSTYTGARYRQDCTITTPGEVAAKALTTSISDVPYLRIINSNDLLTPYLTAIFNAATNKLTQVAIGGIQGLVANATQGATINPVLPCAGLDGDAFTACEASVNAEGAVYNGYQTGSQAIAAQPLDLRNQLSDILTQSIAAQTPYVDALQQLAVCQGISSVPQLQQEQDLLSTLQIQFNDNQTFIDLLNNNAASSTQVQANTGITQTNLNSLTQLAQTAASSANDTSSISTAISDAQNQLFTIQNNVSANMPNIQAQLQSCPNVISTSTPTG